MLDSHCHILPGVDDGCQTLADSIAMAQFCVRDGITHIVATPHCHRYVHLLRETIVPRVAQLNQEFKKAEIPLVILPGSEIQVTDSADYRREFETDVFCHYGAGHAFTLLEFNWAIELFPQDAVQLIEWLRAKGMTPILAHPERHNFFAGEKRPTLEAMVKAGAWVQITVDSLLGNHGALPKALGEQFLRDFPLAILATDAHNMIRCSGLSAGYAWVQKHLSTYRADDLRARANDLLTALLPTEVGAAKVAVRGE